MLAHLHKLKSLLWIHHILLATQIFLNCFHLLSYHFLIRYLVLLIFLSNLFLSPPDSGPWHCLIGSLTRDDTAFSCLLDLSIFFIRKRYLPCADLLRDLGRETSSLLLSLGHTGPSRDEAWFSKLWNSLSWSRWVYSCQIRSLENPEELIACLKTIFRELLKVCLRLLALFRWSTSFQPVVNILGDLTVHLIKLP